ncbi:NFACT RNA binding domain-containing protein [Arcobacter sp.]|uniref:NFACT RNA binding domain-containing protein n=1 Tax=Arcobacter sp. TaxID=1872629 RepID=UPI003D0F3337
MKYYALKNIINYLNENCNTIRNVKRVENNTIFMEFNDRNTIYFDMSKSNSLIYKKDEKTSTKKDFIAPFDTILQKRFNNSKIKNITMHNDDKIIRFYVNSKSSYKELTTILQLEFTGKHTNIIILDENEIILEALRHIDEFSSSRVVKVGEKLEEIPKQTFIPKMEEIEDTEEFLYNNYSQKEQSLLVSLKKQKVSLIEKNCNKLSKILKSLPKKEELEEESLLLYEKANLILANLHKIKPYQKIVHLDDYNGNIVEIDLSECSNPSTFANELFKKAKKFKQKSLYISIEKENLEKKIEFLNRMITNVNLCKSIDEVEFLLPKKQKNQTKTKKQEPYESFFFEGYRILLGTDERSNIYLLQNSKASDFWFHMQSTNSAHVIVQNTKKTLPIDVIYKAAEICVKFSTDFGGKYLVDFTQRRNVKVQNGANVLYNPYDTIDVHI